MTDHASELRAMTDDELIAEYRKLKTEAGGQDPALAPPEESVGALREEMDRRGLSPDREDVVPDEDSPTKGPIVEDQA